MSHQDRRDPLPKDYQFGDMAIKTYVAEGYLVHVRPILTNTVIHLSTFPSDDEWLKGMPK